MRKVKLETLLQNPLLERTLLKPTGRQTLHWSLYAPGLPKGTLTHFEGQGRTSAFMQLLTEHPGLSAAWLEKGMTAYPPAFSRAGVNLDQLLFVEGGKHYAWSAAQLLRTQIFPIVLLASPIEGELELRRLQLAAEQSSTVVLLLSKIQGPTWPIRLWLEIHQHDQGLRLTKYSPTAELRAAV